MLFPCLLALVSAFLDSGILCQWLWKLSHSVPSRWHADVTLGVKACIVWAQIWHTLSCRVLRVIPPETLKRRQVRGSTSSNSMSSNKSWMSFSMGSGYTFMVQGSGSGSDQAHHTSSGFDINYSLLAHWWWLVSCMMSSVDTILEQGGMKMMLCHICYTPVQSKPSQKGHICNTMMSWCIHVKHLMAQQLPLGCFWKCKHRSLGPVDKIKVVIRHLSSPV